MPRPLIRGNLAVHRKMFWLATGLGPSFAVVQPPGLVPRYSPVMDSLGWSETQAQAWNTYIPEDVQQMHHNPSKAEKVHQLCDRPILKTLGGALNCMSFKSEAPFYTYRSREEGKRQRYLQFAEQASLCARGPPF